MAERALLVAAGGGIGDTLLATVVAQALRSRFASVDALVLPAHRGVVERTPAIDRVHLFLGSALAVGAGLRPERYAASVTTWATAATAFAPFAAGIPLRVGQARRLYSGLFSRRVVVRSELGDRTTPWTEILLDYARALGCDLPDPQPRFVPTAGDRAEAAALLRGHASGPPYLLLHPTRGLSAHRERWPGGGFVRLARALRERAPVLVTGSEQDAHLGREIAEAAGAGVTSIAGATSLGGFGALAAGALGVVAMDSGPMHLAAAVGAPTAGIFALQSDEPDRWAPRGPRVAVVRASYPCPPSHRKETCPDFACVRELDVNAILQALDRASAAPRA
jgi:ADP-heptose:LPS heptosyltransferase